MPVWWQAVSLLAYLPALGANLIYHFFDPQVSINPDGKIVNVLVVAADQTGFGGQRHSSALRMDTVTYGMPMLAALALITRADSLWARARALVVGLAVMLALTVPVVMVWAKITSLQLDDRIAQTAMSGSAERSSFFYYAFHGYAFSQPVVAVVIWMALVLLGVFKDKPKATARAVAVARNAACPCGSGRKYKRCCGRPSPSRHSA